MSYPKFAITLILVPLTFFRCKKNSNTSNHDLTALEQKLLGKWNLDNVSGYRNESGYWIFKSTVIDSLSSPTETYRELEVRTTGGCDVKGFWNLKGDSTLRCSCISTTKLLKLTNDSLVFRYSYYVYLDYFWKR